LSNFVLSSAVITPAREEVAALIVPLVPSELLTNTLVALCVILILVVTFGEELVTVMLPEEVIGEPVIDMPVPPTRVTLVTVPVLFVNPLGFVAAYAPISASVHATLALPLNVLPVEPMVRVLAVVSVAAEPVVFWFQVGTVPVKPEYATFVAVDALPVSAPINVVAVAVPVTTRLPSAGATLLAVPTYRERDWVRDALYAMLEYFYKFEVNG
jgi:hypothetical protein